MSEVSFSPSPATVDVISDNSVWDEVEVPCEDRLNKSSFTPECWETLQRVRNSKC